MEKLKILFNQIKPFLPLVLFIAIAAAGLYGFHADALRAVGSRVWRQFPPAYWLWLAAMAAAGAWLLRQWGGEAVRWFFHLPRAVQVAVAGAASALIFFVLWRSGSLKNDALPAALAALLISAPVAFTVWRFRDENQSKDINLKEFQKISEWVTGAHFGEAEKEKLTEKKFSGSRQNGTLPFKERNREYYKTVKNTLALHTFSKRDGAVGLQIAAVYNLLPFYRGDYGRDFEKPAVHLLLSAWKVLQHDILQQLEQTDDLEKQKEWIEKLWERADTPLGQAITRVLLACGHDKKPLLHRHQEVLAGICLSGMDFRLAGVETDILRETLFCGQNWRGAQLHGLRNTEKFDFSKALLFRANLSGAVLFRANLSGAGLRVANLSGAQLDGANLSGARLDWANLSGAQLGVANLSGAQLDGANLSGARLDGANLSGLVLDGANLSGLVLDGANLSGARLGRANLSGARLDRANLSGARLDRANLSDTQLDRANLSGAALKGTDLSGAWLDRVNLSGAWLDMANLSGTVLDGANLSGAVLFRANLSGAVLVGVNLFGAVVGEANLSGARLDGADLSGAVLGGADLSGARLDGADLSGAVLDGANLSGARLDGANLLLTKYLSAKSLLAAESLSGSLLDAENFAKLNEEQQKTLQSKGLVILHQGSETIPNKLVCQYEQEDWQHRYPAAEIPFPIDLEQTRAANPDWEIRIE